RDALRRENVWRQTVFEVENADEFCLIDQWQTENGTGATLSDVGIGRKRVLSRCIIENHGLSRAHGIANERLRQCPRNLRTAFPHMHDYILSPRGCLRVYL